MLGVGFLNRVNDAAQRFLGEPHRDLRLEHTATPAGERIVLGFAAPRPVVFAPSFASHHKDDFVSTRLGAQEAPNKLVMGFGLAKSMQVDFAVYFDAAAPYPLRGFTVDVVESRGGWAAGLRRTAWGRGPCGLAKMGALGSVVVAGGRPGAGLARFLPWRQRQGVPHGLAPEPFFLGG